MRPIFIIGYMASGKTTFGRALAKRINRDFIDLDFYIQQRFRTTVKDFFATRGEAAFRSVEAALLREVGEFEDVIIACGGGTPCFHQNMDYILSKGTTIWITADSDCIFSRVKLKPGKRPLLAGLNDIDLKNKILKGLDERNPFYRRAHIHFSGQHLETIKEITRSLDRFLNEHPLITKGANL